MKHFIALAAMGLCLAGPLRASEEVDHYEPVQSETFAEAVENFRTYNARLAALLAQETLSAGDIEEIHEYTYTLEIALAKINETLATLPQELEELHLASEDHDEAALRAAAPDYIDAAMLLQ